MSGYETYRGSPESREMLTALMKKWGVTRSEANRYCVIFTHSQVLGNVGKMKNPLPQRGVFLARGGSSAK